MRLMSIAGAMFLASGANAQTVSLEFTGELVLVQSSGDVNLSDDFAIGQTASGVVTIDTSVLDTDDAINVGEFQDALLSLSVTIDGTAGAYGVDSLGPTVIRAVDNASLNQFPQADYISTAPAVDGAPVDGAPLDFAWMLLYDFSNVAFPAQDPQTLTPLWDLNTFPDEGISIDWRLSGRGGTSSTGRVQIGMLTWTVVEDCPADVNGDGTASPADFTAWLGCFSDPGSAPFCDRADVNGSGAVDPADFTAWLAAFNAGCD